MLKSRTHACALSMVLIGGGGGMAALSGCENLPGGRNEQATVIGGAAGALLGAAIASENRLLGALIGGALGAGAGYIVGSQTDWFEGDDDDAEVAAREAIEEADEDPATPAEARRASTADINGDGFVTLDEVVAMERAGFSDREMLDRLEATGQVFDLTPAQEQYLLAEGVSNRVVRDMVAINQTQRNRLLTRGNEVIGSDR